LISAQPRNRDSKLETPNSESENRLGASEFRLSSFEYRPLVNRPFAILLLLILATPACRWFQTQPPRESDRRELAARFQNVVAAAGGAHIWIKHISKFRHGHSPAEISMQVVAAPAAYHAVLSRVKLESDQNKLDCGISETTAASGRHVAVLNVRQRGQSIIQIHLREVPRLLQAAIVIDDMGRDLDAAHKLLALDYPLTFSVLPHLQYSQTTAQDVHRSGREVMLHLPMEPEPRAHTSPGEGAILVGMNEAEVRRVILSDLATVPYVAGVNNHMGSRATQDSALMADVMKILEGQRLYFIDSRTTAASKAWAAAEHQNLPAFYRSVFLDDTETVPYTLGQLRTFRHKVEQEGVALAIGHPHATTIAALAKFLPELESADIELVAPSQIVREPEIARLHPPASPN
jgi:polysaccharide deacetylase 2 family uncharacterized protein YibQ